MAFDDVNKYNEMINDARIRAILKAQEQIESSGGRNVNHQEIDYGMHRGTSAKGRYGIMPATLKDFAKNMPRDKEAQEAASIEDDEALKEYFKSHPQLEDRLAMQYIEHANKKMGGDYDPEKITYSWQWGQNKTPEDFEKDKNKPEVQDRLSKMRAFLKDPYPPQGPKAPNDSERALAQNDPTPQVTPSPMPNFSPEREEDVVAPMEFNGQTEVAEEPKVENKFQQLSQMFSPKSEFKKMEPENMYKEQFSLPVKNQEEPIQEERALTPRLMSMLMEKRRK